MSYPNVSGYDEKGFAPPLNPGSYLVKLDEIQKTDKDGNLLKDKNGHEYTRFVFTINDHPGNKLFERFYFDPSGPHADIRLGRFKQFLIAIGASTEGGNFDQLKGMVCRATVKIAEYKDQDGKTKQINNIIVFEATNTDETFGDDDVPF